MFELVLTAELSGVTRLQPVDTESDPFYYMFKVQCTSCLVTHANRVGISRFESHELSGSKGEANFVWKCKNCRREASASIKSGPIPYDISSPPKQVNILAIKCRGCELNDFKPEGDWMAVGEESGTKFEGIDLGDGEWFDYDEKAGQEVSIKDIKWDIKMVKGTKV
ncbi:hypothetical protein BDZ91DRAFT_721366 [Kalaharituber pfeilii]|nr:hypothetical protein BDZ91DRAFT_721366 [Kalaharituber pfeilii]